MEDSKEHLKTLFQEAQVREEKKLDAIKKDNTKSRLILSLRGINEIFFLYSAFVEGNFQQSKEYLFKMSMVNSYFFERTKSNPFEALDTFSFPVLCDNENIINRYSRYVETEKSDGFASYYAKSIQAILKQEDSLLEESIHNLEKQNKNGWKQNYNGIINSLKGILRNNVSEIEHGINEILDRHTYQNHMPMTNQLINYPAVTLAKLAHKNNLNVKIDNHLIPDALIYFKPLENYIGYDFFDDLNNSNEV